MKTNAMAPGEIIIEPYVTDRGGVVVLNGPFPVEEAKKAAALCEAAPDLLKAAAQARLFIHSFGPRPEDSTYTIVEQALKAAIAKAEGKA